MLHKLHQNIFGRLKTWVQDHRVIALLLGGLILITATGITAAAILYKPPQPASQQKAAVKKPTPTPAPVVYYSPLTGEKVPDQASTQQAVTGVMIENSPDARPQSGLKAAGVVYEAIAEGGITRFMALYQQSKPQLLGPVRSLRFYDVEWLAPFQASIAHVGGSQQALAEIRNGSYRDLDQFFNSAYYWRTNDRPAPHNVYTSFEKLDALNSKKGYNTSTFTAWPRQDGKPAKTTTANSIDVTISAPLYNSHYNYDIATNTYTRYQAGAPHLDRESGGITPSVVIVMEVDEQTVMQDGYREQITTVGSGKAHIFENGTETEATWTKTDRGTQTTFTDSAGKQIPLNRGQTWITAVPVNRGGGVKWQ